MKKYWPNKVALATVVLLSFNAGPPLWAQDATLGANIALGKSVTVSPNPNTPQSGNKPESLTDGIQGGPIVMWVKPGAVGWTGINPAAIVVDLGSVQPISGCSFHSGAGMSDVTWPNSIHLAVSDDQKTWRYAGELVSLSAKNSTPPAYGLYREHAFVTHDIKAKGRYVAFGVSSQLYTTTDEVEVFAGEKAWLNEPDGTIAFPSEATNILDYMASLTVKDGQNRRVDTDRGIIRESIAKSQLPEVEKRALAAELALTEKLDITQPLPGINYKAIAPVNTVHRAVLAVQGQLLAAQGFKPLNIWTAHRYGWVPLVSTPLKDTKNELTFSMLRNQFRAQILLLTNASGTAQTVQLKLINGPAKTQNGWLQVDQVEWTDTQPGIVVADALVPIAAKNGVYNVSVPAGMTRKLWFTLDSSKVPAGDYKSSFAIQSGTFKSSVPLNIKVAATAMKRPRISLGMWDDIDGADFNAALGITMKNREAALKLMQSHYVDTAWGKIYSLPWPKDTDFDADNNLISKLDYTRLDRWLDTWPEARHFINFLNSGHEFAGTKMGTPEFNARLGNWSRELWRHLRERGIKPKQFAFLIFDEQRTDEHDEITALWATAFKAAAPELAIFTDPHWIRPDERPNQKALNQSDIICPSVLGYYRGGEPAKAWYDNLMKQGSELWLYQCAGPVRLFDPQRYYRYQAWHTFGAGGTGQGFWSFGDIGNGGTTSWNDYSNAPYFSYAPQFIDIDTMNSSVHWESVREGMEDYEELAMLRDAIAASKDMALKREGQKVLDNAVEAVTSLVRTPETFNTERFSVYPPYDWQSTKYDSGLADRHLKNVRAMLLKLSS